MMKSLENKIILVTGGNGLLGKPIIELIKRKGGIAINGDIKNKDDFAKGELYLDVSDSNSIKLIIDKIIDEYSKIDGLVNCAYPITKDWGDKFESVKRESWNKNIDLQLNSVFEICQQVLKQMVVKKSGSIVNFSSIYGSTGPDFMVYEGTELTMPAAYSAIKGAITNFTRYLASYYGESNIRVNTVSPGGVWDNQNEIFVQKYSQRVPMKRMAKPEEIAPAVCFLLGDEASYITGQNLHIDGGWTAI